LTPLPTRLARALPVTVLPGPLPLRHHSVTLLSRVSRLTDSPPYWAYLWPGGAALIAHLVAHPALVRDKRVLDLGAGGGLVGIAAMRLGAASVIGSDIDPVAREVAQMNAALNDVALTLYGDLLDGEPPKVDLIVVGDLFYAADLATRVLTFLLCAVGQGTTVLVGDIGRADLPAEAFQTLATYPVRDVGDGPGTAPHQGRVMHLPAGSGSPGD